MYLHSSGEVYPCGFLQGRYSYGNINQNSLINIWNSEKSRSFRDLHAKGQNEYCTNCQKKYTCHLLHDNLWDQDKSQTVKLKKLDIMVDSFCNLKCIMCTNRSEVNGGFKDPEFWSSLETEIIPYLEEIELVGGEPLISKDTYKLFDLVLKVKPDIRWIITTNGHMDFSDYLVKYLDRLNIYSFSISVDSVHKENFKKIRVNGDLNKTLNFLFKAQEFKEKHGKNFYLNVNFLIQKDNALELKEVLDYFSTKNLKVYPILLREPKEYSILDLPTPQLKTILENYLALAESNMYAKNISLKIFNELPANEKVYYIEELQRV